jgi:hypothetical protein
MDGAGFQPLAWGCLRLGTWDVVPGGAPLALAEGGGLSAFRHYSVAPYLESRQCDFAMAANASLPLRVGLRLV